MLKFRWPFFRLSFREGYKEVMAELCLDHRDSKRIHAYTSHLKDSKYKEGRKQALHDMTQLYLKVKRKGL